MVVGHWGTMVRIWSDMTGSLMVAAARGCVPFLSRAVFSLFQSSVRTKQVLRKRSLQGTLQ